jgi:hypothetical protein
MVLEAFVIGIIPNLLILEIIFDNEGVPYRRRGFGEHTKEE